jgi:YidC/Oxa1 family membrane protein insertase
MMIAGIFEVPAAVLAFFYSITTNYALAISMIAVLVMLLVTPLNLKSTKGMLEMQRLAPEMRKLQNQYKGDRTKLNEEMMKLYQEHKVNPMASCLPLVAQMPIFIIMFRILHGMTYQPVGGDALVAQAVLDAGGDTRPIGFVPRYLSQGSELYQSLVRSETMTSFGLDLSKSAKEMLGIDFAKGLIYSALVVLLGLRYLVQQRMVASRAAVSPTMSPTQQKLMQYLPVAFAVFQVFFLLGLVVYYLVQTVLRIAQQYYITKRFYSGEESLGRQAQAASAHARELAKADGGGGQSAPSKRDQAEARKNGKKDAPSAPVGPAPTKRTTPAKNRPTPTAQQAANRPGGSRSTSKKRNG